MIIEELSELEHQSLIRGIPIIGREKGAWLLDKIKTIRPKRILELGTANGYSGIILGSESGKLTTIELDAKIAKEAEMNFKQFGIKAEVVVGDGVDLIHKMAKEKQDCFDLIFIDFAKKSYIKVLEESITLVKNNGLIIADNVNMEKCSSFKHAVLNHPRLRTEIININDGLSYSSTIK